MVATSSGWGWWDFMGCNVLDTSRRGPVPLCGGLVGARRERNSDRGRVACVKWHGGGGVILAY